MLHVISIAGVSGISRILRSYRFIIVILGSLFDRISRIFSNRSDNSWVSSSGTITTSSLSLDLSWLLIADFDIGKMILVISVNSSCDSIWLTLRNAPFISINKLVLSGIMRIFWVIERVTANLNFTAIDINLLSVLTTRVSPSLFRLLSLWLLREAILVFKNTSWREDSKLEWILNSISHRSFSKFPTRYSFSYSWSIKVI